ncbi:MAG: NAD(+) synthase [Eubacteriaceae bacterium]|jgi:NAD+ synthase (glutamine-hydrolysing)|nr:NAD(+) synthase [Eubacteriaceae bacterium]
MNRYGFLRVAAAILPLHLGNVAANVEEIKYTAEVALSQGVQVLVYPEMALTGATCGDYFLQPHVLEGVAEGLKELCRYTEKKGIALVVGGPVQAQERLYNAAFFIHEGRILGCVPKTHLKESEIWEGRWFESGKNLAVQEHHWQGLSFPLGPSLHFQPVGVSEITLAIAIGEDLKGPLSPVVYHALAGANALLHLGAAPLCLDGGVAQEDVLSVLSSQNHMAIISADGSVGESSGERVYIGEGFIYENGALLSKGATMDREIHVVSGDIDGDYLMGERRRKKYRHHPSLSNFDNTYKRLTFHPLENRELKRKISQHPLIPESEKDLEKMLDAQALGLATRMAHLKDPRLVIGISGGLDSTAALLACQRACDRRGLDNSHILAVTMPGFGTTGQTYDNALQLIEAIGAELMEIDIQKSCLQHFADIGHSPEVHDLTYENAQARERTQILMDLSNKHGGIVIGTGNMSEMALGWSTYNGDQMSMYGVNAAFPKTLVRRLTEYVAQTSTGDLAETLKAILDTPVSPELLPPDREGNIQQKTEEVVGPYRLHDFFLAHKVLHQFKDEKILFLAEIAFQDIYDKETIAHWLSYFNRRFISQQFKRSSSPEAPAILALSLSPRGGFVMVSDIQDQPFVIR